MSRAPHLERIVFEFLQSGGPLMIPIGLCSVVGMAAFLERLWALRQGRVLPRSLRVAVMDLVRQGRFEDALIACRQSESPFGRVAEAVLRGRGRARADVKELAEEVGRREAAELERYSGIVGIVAAISPLLGLLGTVWGMILTFRVIEEGGIGQVGQLAGGISTALVTTFAGLSVGIPALMAHRWLLARVDDLLLDMEEAALELLDRVAAEPSVASPAVASPAAASAGSAE